MNLVLQKTRAIEATTLSYLWLNGTDKPLLLEPIEVCSSTKVKVSQSCRQFFRVPFYAPCCLDSPQIQPVWKLRGHHRVLLMGTWWFNFCIFNFTFSTWAVQLSYFQLITTSTFEFSTFHKINLSVFNSENFQLFAFSTSDKSNFSYFNFNHFQLI